MSSKSKNALIFGEIMNLSCIIHINICSCILSTALCNIPDGQNEPVFNTSDSEVLCNFSWGSSSFLVVLLVSVLS